MTTTTVRIAIQRGGKVQPRENRQAVWAEGGLAITRDPNEQTWAVTHVASGYAIVHGIRTQRNAKVAALRFLPITDWTASRTALTNSSVKRDARLVKNALIIEGVLAS